MVRDSRPPSDDPLEEALFRWLDPDGFASRSSPPRPRGREVDARDRDRLETIVSESSADLRRLDPERLLSLRPRRAPRRGCRRGWIAWLLLGVTILAIAATLAASI